MGDVVRMRVRASAGKPLVLPPRPVTSELAKAEHVAFVLAAVAYGFMLGLLCAWEWPR